MLLRLFVWIWLASALAPSASLAETRRIEVDHQVPPLSLKSLYHPEDRFKYVDSPTPSMRWIKSLDGTSELLIKRGDEWKAVDLQNAEEAPYAVASRLETSLRKLENFDEKHIPQVVDKWIQQTETVSEPALIAIDDSLLLIRRGSEAQWVTRSATAWREASISPDSQQVAYVEGNDLYLMQIESGRVTRVTHDGSKTRLNGVLDWVYQEEIYGRGNFRGYWWRQDSAAIAFLRLDTSEVAEFTITGSKQPRGETMVERYPKVGDAIPEAELWCAAIDRSSSDGGVTLIPLLKDSLEPDTLITRVGWHGLTQELLAQTANRVQNDASLYKIHVDAPAQRKVILRERCDQWLEVQELPKILKTSEYLRLSDLPEGRRRLWRISEDGTNRLPLTPGDFDVREIVFVDPDGRNALVTGDRLRGTIGQQLYRVDLRSPSPPKRLSDESPWHSVMLSSDGRWMVDRASSLTRPTSSWLRSLSEPSTEPHLIHQERLKLPAAPQEVTWPTIKADDQVLLPAYLIRPLAEADQAKKYPVLIEIYGGPLTPTVRDAWSAGRYLFHQLLARQGIGVLVVDNRSSGGRGLADSWAIHRRMGEIESKDLVAAAGWLADQPWVDPQRLALRGWSFGGFLTLHAMTHSERFAAGVAGGSVTDWRNYDAVYTERYMGLPSDNPAGYDSTSPLLGADKLHGRVLLLHGEVDDNVHLANTMQMAAALQRAGKPFDMMIYPGSAHAVHNPHQNYHLMLTTLEFLRRELRIEVAK